MACECSLSSGMSRLSMTRSVPSCCSCAHSGASSCGGGSQGPEGRLGQGLSTVVDNWQRHQRHLIKSGADKTPRQTCLGPAAAAKTQPQALPHTCVSFCISSASQMCSFSSRPVLPPCTRWVWFLCIAPRTAATSARRAAAVSGPNTPSITAKPRRRRWSHTWGVMACCRRCTGTVGGGVVLLPPAPSPPLSLLAVLVALAVLVLNRRSNAAARNIVAFSAANGGAAARWVLHLPAPTSHARLFIA